MTARIATLYCLREAYAVAVVAWIDRIREYAAEDEKAVRRLLASHSAGTMDRWARDVAPAAERPVDVTWLDYAFA